MRKTLLAASVCTALIVTVCSSFGVPVAAAEQNPAAQTCETITISVPCRCASSGRAEKTGSVLLTREVSAKTEKAETFYKEKKQLPYEEEIVEAEEQYDETDEMISDDIVEDADETAAAEGSDYIAEDEQADDRYDEADYVTEPFTEEDIEEILAECGTDETEFSWIEGNGRAE
ncbi:MAG: hypothetical protein Q4B09_05950 [Lachnospiraceae bacterium]|nr:hypothetical protein [Lachnospiraceae bacterium]